MRKLMLLVVLLSGCSVYKTHVIVREVKATHMYAPMPVTSVSMKTTYIPVSAYKQSEYCAEVPNDFWLANPKWNLK